MAVLPAARVSALLAALAAVVALGAGCGSSSDDLDPAPASAPLGAPATTDQSAAATAPTEDQFCALFVQFASDQSLHAGEQTSATTEALIRSGLTLAHLPPTDTMTPAVHASLVNLVAETLDGIVAPADLPVVDGTPDEAAFSHYLNESCPA